MKFIRNLLINHPLVNILFSVVLIMGFLSFIQMPIEQEPEINFNLVSVNTVLPGASAADVEQLVTGPLEDALRNVQDIKFVASNSRESVSNIFIRFREISEREFDKRVTDIRREIQSKANDELPDDIQDPYVQELTTSNGFPTAMVLVVGQARPFLGSTITHIQPHASQKSLVSRQQQGTGDDDISRAVQQAHAAAHQLPIE